MIDIFNKEIEPLLLAYGKACYAAQNLESTLRFLLVLNRSQKDKQIVSADSIAEIDEETNKEAVFALFQRARKIEYFTSKEERLVKAAIRSRNYLMHEFWSKNIKMVSTAEGREKIASELASITQQVHKADEIVVSLIDKYMVKYGITTDILKKMAEQSYELGALNDEIVRH